MVSPADLLWRINNEYQKRLKQATNTLNLLEQLVLTQGGEGYQHTLTTLHHVLEQVRILKEEHREWRYTYFYESLESKRMVQSDNAVNRALARFVHMRNRHEQQLQSLNALLEHIQRPDRHITTVATGDLWELTEYAIHDLSGFDDYLSALPEV
jgi:hypothetical protein